MRAGPEPLSEWIDAVTRAAVDAAREEASEARAGRAAASPSAPPAGDVTPGARLARAESLLASAHPREALAELDAAEGGSPSETARRDALRGLALLALGRPGEAEAAARAALGSGACDDGSQAAARLALARAAARAGRRDQAIRLYRDLARTRVAVPGLPAPLQRDLADDASFLAAWLPYDGGRYLEASRSMRAWLREHRGSRRADDARWFAAWSLVRAGGRGPARAALRALLPGPHRAGALYWLARLDGRPAAQRRLYRLALQAAGPDAWYGQLAAARLRSLGAAPAPWALPAGAPPGDGPGPGAAGRALARAARLLGAAHAAEARAELSALAASPRARPVAAQLAQLASGAGFHPLALRVARDLLPPSRRALRWMHPDPWGAALAPVAGATGVDHDLLLALIRRESGFRAGIRSAAGALGLVQLLPDTAGRLAAAAGIPAARADLLDPVAALPLGALYLGLLRDRLGSVPAALAGYNAGPTAAARWAAELARRPLDEWVEDLPYRETRRYLKAVLADAQVYRWLARRGDLGIDGTSPVPAPGVGIAF